MFGVKNIPSPKKKGFNSALTKALKL